MILKIKKKMVSGILVILWQVTRFWFPAMVAFLKDFVNAIATKYFHFVIQWRCYPSSLLQTKTSSSPFINIITKTIPMMRSSFCPDIKSILYFCMVYTLMVVFNIVGCTVNGHIKLPENPLLSRYLKQIYNRNSNLPCEYLGY